MSPPWLPAWLPGGLLKGHAGGYRIAPETYLAGQPGNQIDDARRAVREVTVGYARLAQQLRDDLGPPDCVTPNRGRRP